MSSRWCGIEVMRRGRQLRHRPRHLIILQNYEVRCQRRLKICIVSRSVECPQKLSSHELVLIDLQVPVRMPQRTCHVEGWRHLKSVRDPTWCGRATKELLATELISLSLGQETKNSQLAPLFSPSTVRKWKDFEPRKI
ncbi:hypothetical protein TNCV_2564511 [Trichonephila clavipes]|nr:hypothetical protein TNCV_2564511 [Trichonephila clavipes]